jgi:hypothetical protein
MAFNPVEVNEMSAVEQELIEKINHLSPEQQQQVLEFVEHLERRAPQKTYSARELMRLPHEERQRLVHAAFALAADEEFEIFEAYSEEEFDDPA